MRYNWMIITFLNGIWRIPDRMDPVFNIQKDVITTHAESAIITMKPAWRERQIQLSNLTIVKRPSDWMNIVKYRKKIGYYNEIKQHGLLLNLTFINETFVRIQTKILDEQVEFTIEKEL
jgi:hypothetical protein